MEALPKEESFRVMDFSLQAFWVPLLQIIWINIVLSPDNTMLIQMICSSGIQKACSENSMTRQLSPFGRVSILPRASAD